MNSINISTMGWPHDEQLLVIFWGSPELRVRENVKLVRFCQVAQRASQSALG